MLEWFITIPGILITCGVILLVVALILFILGNKKEKKSDNIAMNTGMTNQPLINDEVATVEPNSMIIDTPVSETKIDETVTSEPSVIDFTPASENVTPVSDFTQPSESVTQFSNLNQPSDSVAPVSNFAQPMMNFRPANEETKPTGFGFTPASEVVSDVTSQYDFTLPEEKAVEEVKIEEPEVKIYGGNDPLINTGIPVQEPTHQPYGGINEATVVQPVVPPVVEKPTSSAIPTISIPEPIVADVKEEL